MWASVVASAVRVASIASDPSALSDPANTSSPGLLLDRDALARDRRLVDRGTALDDAAVDGHALAGPDEHAVADPQFGRIDVGHAVPVEPMGHRGRQFHQRADGAPGAIQAVRLDPQRQGEKEHGRGGLEGLADGHRPDGGDAHQDVHVQRPEAHRPPCRPDDGNAGHDGRENRQQLDRQATLARCHREPRPRPTARGRPGRLSGAIASEPGRRTRDRTDVGTLDVEPGGFDRPRNRGGVGLGRPEVDLEGPIDVVRAGRRDARQTAEPFFDQGHLLGAAQLGDPKRGGGGCATRSKGSFSGGHEVT